MRSRIPLIVSLVFSVSFLVPLFFMIRGGLLSSPTSTAFTLTYVVNVFRDPNTLAIVINTFEYAGGGAIIGIALAAPYAWIMVRTDVPGKRFLRILPILPLTIPLVIKGFAWIFLFSPEIGIVNLFLRNYLGFSYSPLNIYSMLGMQWAWGAGAVPFMYLLMEAIIQEQDQTLEEAARASGSGLLTTTFRVSLPLMMPGILMNVLLSTISGVGNFDYPFILGLRANLPTLATQMFTFANIGQFSQASAYGIVFLLVTGALITIYIGFTKNSFKYAVITGATKQKVLRLGRWRWTTFAFCMLIMTAVFILPFSMLLVMSFATTYTVANNAVVPIQLTLNNYVLAFKVPNLFASAVNSWELAIVTGVAATIVGTIMSYAMVKGDRFRGTLSFISSLPLGFPGILYSVAIVWTVLTVPGLSILYGTIWIMLLTLVIVWLPFSIRVMSATVIQLSNELEEAASICGSSWFRTMRHVTVPLLRGGFVNAMTYVLINSFREVGPVILLYNSSSLLFIIVILNLYETSAAYLPVVAALSTILTAMLLVTVVVTRRFVRSPYRKVN